jgi:hypothetical protein
MSQQDYNNHVRYYTPHHFIFYPVLLILLVLAVRQVFVSEEMLVWSIIASGLFFLGWLSFMMRQHYALTLQNRLVILEMRLRYYQLTGKRLETFEDKLGGGRIAALRFASDDELPGLLEKALSENLSADQIKKSVKDWQPDHRRV